MIELGKIQSLNVVNKTDFGIYLGNIEEKVLLPIKQVPEDIEVGDAMEVFVYRDSSDRLISTTREPAITLGQIALLQVKQTAAIGAFMDWGLEKDLLLPFKEQTCKVNEGDSFLVALYTDKSNRLCATMKIEPYLDTAEIYQKDDSVTCTVYEINDRFGAYAAIDNKFFGLIPIKDIHKKLRIGQTLECRVTEVREDGKINLSMRQKIQDQMSIDAELILKVMEAYNGTLPFSDKADPDTIKKEFSLSKNAFKRAVGKLLKEGMITIEKDSISLK